MAWCRQATSHYLSSCWTKSLSSYGVTRSQRVKSSAYLVAKMARHDDVIKWKQLPRYWPFVRGIHQSPVNSPHKGQWRGALMLSLICICIKGWVNNREAGDLRCYPAHYDVTVMQSVTVLKGNMNYSLINYLDNKFGLRKYHSYCRALMNG